MKITKPVKHTITIKESKRQYTDYDTNGNCQEEFVVVEVEKDFYTFVTEYKKSTDYKPVKGDDGESIMNLANACITSILSKGVTPKMNELFIHKSGRRKADYDDLVSNFMVALLERDSDNKYVIDYDFDEVLHSAYLSTYNYLYDLGVTKASKNPRYSMLSLDSLLYTDDGEEVRKQDKALVVFMLYDNINMDYIDYNGITLSKKYIAYLKAKIDRQLTDRQKTVFDYMLDGVSKSNIAEFVGVSRPTLYKDIKTIDEVIREVAESVKLFKTPTH